MAKISKFWPNIYMIDKNYEKNSFFYNNYINLHSLNKEYSYN